MVTATAPSMALPSGVLAGREDPSLHPGAHTLRRPGRRLVPHLVRAGHAGHVDGVAALTHRSISRHLGEYRAQLHLAQRNGGFAALAMSETGGPR